MQQLLIIKGPLINNSLAKVNLLPANRPNQAVRLADVFSWQCGRMVLLVTLDVKNGLNSNCFHIPGNLFRALREHLKDHVLLYNLRRAEQNECLIRLRFEMANASHLVGYMDDAATLVPYGRPSKFNALKMVIRQVSRWVTEHGFSLALPVSL